MAVGTQFSPTDVMMGRGSGSPYLWMGAGAAPPKPKQPGSVGPITKQQSTGPAAPGGTLGPSSVRATGSGPFDAAYRQNLATYAGGNFAQPSGGLSFNPTDISTFPGQPTGGGTAPVLGMPQSLIDMGLAGQGFSWSPPAAAAPATPDFSTLQDWMQQFLMGGSKQRGANIL